jgi:hypothetical protein
MAGGAFAALLSGGWADPRFVAIASATPPDQMHFLDTEELELLNVNWRPKDFEPWSIEPSGRGVIVQG